MRCGPPKIHRSWVFRQAVFQLFLTEGQEFAQYAAETGIALGDSDGNSDGKTEGSDDNGTALGELVTITLKPTSLFSSWDLMPYLSRT
jgi:hypothetical protein